MSMLSLITSAAAAVVTAPNIIVIFSDDHARQAISAYGSTLIQTPSIDRLAREGVTFDRHTIPNPLCGPSRACLFTGKHSHLNGFKDNVSTFDGSQVTFPKLLQQAGYETAAIGKWHLVSDPTGLDHWDVLPGQGVYHNPDFLTPKGRVKNKGYATEIITDKAVDWLKQGRKKPFFLFLGHKAPHRNWEPRIKDINRWAGVRFPEPSTLRTDYATLARGAQKALMRIDRHMRQGVDLLVDWAPPQLDGKDREVWRAAWGSQNAAYHQRLSATGDLMGVNYQRYIANYLRCISVVDEGVGEVMAALKKSGQDKNTIVVYTSDQGFFLGEKGWYDKRWFYEPSAGTPLIVRFPDKMNQGRRVSVPTSGVDMAPTILEWAGLKAPVEMQGESLNPLVKGELSARRPVYGHFYEDNDPDHKVPKYTAIATERWKLICYYDLGECELFDLRSDPTESRNLWLGGGDQRVKAEMVRKLSSEMRRLKEDGAVIQKVEKLLLK